MWTGGVCVVEVAAPGSSSTLPDRSDPAQWPTLRARFTERFRSRTRDEWSAVFHGTDACVAPVLTPDEAPSHPHLADRATFAELGGVLQPAPAPRFSRTPAQLTRPPAAAGTETREALMDWGIEGVDALLISGAAHQA